MDVTTCAEQAVRQLAVVAATPSGCAGWWPTCSTARRSTWVRSTSSAPRADLAVARPRRRSRRPHPRRPRSASTLDAPTCPERCVMMIDRDRMRQVVGQPGLERHQVHPARRHGRTSGSASTATGSSSPSPTPASASPRRDRDRLFTRFFRATPRRGAEHPGRRPRPVDHQVDRREPRRPDRGRQRGRPRQHLPGPAAARLSRLAARPADASAAARAVAEDLQRVADVGVPVLLGDRPAHRSTAGPSTSTVAPHARQTRWW